VACRWTTEEIVPEKRKAGMSGKKGAGKNYRRGGRRSPGVPDSRSMSVNLLKDDVMRNCGRPA
jgi:hypothetical protein